MSENKLIAPMTIRRRAYAEGVRAAADVADNYNSTTTHEYRLGDCIAGKLNVRKTKPRRNKLCTRNATKDAMICGVVLGVADMLRVCHDQNAAADALRNAGITRRIAKQAGAPDVDLNEIDWRKVHAR